MAAGRYREYADAQPLFAHIVITVFNHQFDIAVGCITDFLAISIILRLRARAALVGKSRAWVRFGPVSGAFHAGKMIKPS